MEQQQISLSLSINDVKKQIAEIVNNSNLEPVIWKYIFKEFLDEVSLLEASQLQKELQQQKQENQQEVQEIE